MPVDITQIIAIPQADRPRAADMRATWRLLAAHRELRLLLWPAWSR